MATAIEIPVLKSDATSERRSESENSSNTAFDEKAPVVSEKKWPVTSTGDPIYEPVAPLEEIKPIISEFIGIAAGLTTVLLQVAHPVVGRGVGRHSEFSVPKRAQDRAEKTGIFVIAMVFGNDVEKAAVRDYVNKMHGRVKGGEGPTAYYAKDPKGMTGITTFMVTLLTCNQCVSLPSRAISCTECTPSSARHTRYRNLWAFQVKD
jgi:hypothetical protein